jgi:hypothetical protein
MQSMLAIGSTVLGGFLVERGKLLRAEGRLVSCHAFVENACILIAGPLAGYLAGLQFDAATIVCAAIAVANAPIAAVCVAEPLQDKSTNVKLTHDVDGCNFFAHLQHSAIVRNISLFLSKERAHSL